MSEIYVYIIIIVITVTLLNSNFSFGNKIQTTVSEGNLLVVEHLTQHVSKKKNYRTPPENYRSNGYLITGEINGDSAYLEYKFPLIDGSESMFKIKLNTYNTSSVVNQFGVTSDCFFPANKDSYQLATTDESYLRANMNKDGFYFIAAEEGKFGIDFDHVIKISSELGNQIAQHLKIELENSSKDSYENRVRAALNFVQFIPYGVPDFDHNPDGYFGLALPHESLAISYSDCDSKSVLFASILVHLINPENIILVSCKIQEGAHMIAGVAGFNYPGEYQHVNGKDYLLIETTTPHPLESQPIGIYEQIEVKSIRI